MMELYKYNANPKKKVTGDCVVRAIAYASKQSWEEVLEGLYLIAYNEKVMLNEKKGYEKYLSKLGFTKMKQPRKPNGKKYLVCELEDIIDLNKYDAVASVAHHLTALDNINGKNVIVDLWNCGFKTVGNYWVRLKNK